MSICPRTAMDQPLSPIRESNTVAKASRGADAYRVMKEAIRDNVLAPGYHGSEQEIALELGMSRTPVHEALIRLQEEGLVRVIPKRGVIVCALSPNDMREVYDVIIALEGMAAALTARMTEPERCVVVGALEIINGAMNGALRGNDLDAWARADDAFHRALIDRSGNGRLARLANNIMDQSHRARMMTLRLRPKPTESLKEHQGIVAAISAGEAERACALAQAHRQRARDELLPLLDQIGMKRL